MTKPKMIKAFYYNKGNFGDILTPYLVKELFGVDMLHTSQASECNFIGIGSVLEKLREAPTNVTVWGAGFMYDENILQNNSPFMCKGQNILAVRGKLSASRLIGADIKALGDPGLLVDKLVKPSAKYFKIGFIPHYIERQDNLSQHIKGLQGVHYINIMQKPQAFLNEVNKCSYVISSSLHGCIAADALGIPNLHIMLSPKVLGKNYKFMDYYSVFDLNHRFVDFQAVPAREITPRRILNSIEQCYTPKKLDKIQDDLMTSLESWIK